MAATPFTYALLEPWEPVDTMPGEDPRRTVHVEFVFPEITEEHLVPPRRSEEDEITDPEELDPVTPLVGDERPELPPRDPENPLEGVPEQDLVTVALPLRVGKRFQVTAETDEDMLAGIERHGAALGAARLEAAASSEPTPPTPQEEEERGVFVGEERTVNA